MAFNPIETFLQEAEELLADIEQCALTLNSANADAETVNRLFRAFHTLKGSGAMCGMDALVEFTHHVENLLDKVRDGLIPTSPALATLILQSADHIKDLLHAIRTSSEVPLHFGRDLVILLSQVMDSAGPSDPATCQIPDRDAARDCVDAISTWNILFRPHSDLLSNGGNPVALLQDLRNLGRTEVTAHFDEIPELDAFDPDRCYLWWTITVTGPIGENAIRDVFIFVEDGSTLEIRPGAKQSGPAPEPAAEKSQVLHAGSADRLLLSAKDATVRVPSERLDRLVNLVGEFVMNHACLAQAVSNSPAPEFANPLQVLERLVAELRDDVLGIRMLPIGTLFGRFRRVVHDLAAELGKQADLVTEGAETELDKGILEQLGDPLVHCLRNCLDHGVEPTAERLRQGKSPRATIRLSAAHCGSNVVISIEDDGRGIDRQAVRAKAIERHLASPEAVLSESDILDLILLPGFSTAAQVTSVSGRGVGMDVVKRQIDTLRGSLSLRSREGQGTCVSITLPLTLAIIDGLLVQIDGERFILPMSAVSENVELNGSERARNNGRNMLSVRGELVPYIDLRRTFAIGGSTPPVEKVVIVQHGGDRVGLVVERVLGTHQTVIQSLGKFFKKVDVVSGATIMGDGRVALILDIAAVLRHADREFKALPAPVRNNEDLVVAC